MPHTRGAQIRDYWVKGYILLKYTRLYFYLIIHMEVYDDYDLIFECTYSIKLDLMLCIVNKWRSVEIYYWSEKINEITTIIQNQENQIAKKTI